MVGMEKSIHVVNPDLASWKYRKVTKNMLLFFKDTKRFANGIKPIKTINPDPNKLTDGEITLEVFKENLEITMSVDLLAKKHGAFVNGKWQLQQDFYSQTYLFPLKITDTDQILFSLINSPIGRRIYEAAYSIFR